MGAIAAVAMVALRASRAFRARGCAWHGGYLRATSVSASCPSSLISKVVFGVPELQGAKVLQPRVSLSKRDGLQGLLSNAAAVAVAVIAFE